MVIGFRERDAQQSCENLHNKRTECTDVHTIPLALATLSTTAAAINSSCSPFCVIFGPPDRYYTPVPPVNNSGPALLRRQEYHKHPRSPALEQHNVRGLIAAPKFNAAGIYNSFGRRVIPYLLQKSKHRYLYIAPSGNLALCSAPNDTLMTSISRPRRPGKRPFDIKGCGHSLQYFKLLNQKLALDT